MKYRDHRGGLSESMETVVELRDKDALIKHLQVCSRQCPTMPVIDATTVRIVPYVFDDRIGWDTHLVLLKEYGVLGYTDGPVDG